MGNKDTSVLNYNNVFSKDKTSVLLKIFRFYNFNSGASVKKITQRISIVIGDAALTLTVFKKK